MASSEILRPTSAVNALWTSSAVADVDDAVEDPTAGDGAIAQALVADEGEEQIYGLAAPAATDWTHAMLLEVRLYARYVGGGGLHLRVNPTGQAGDWLQVQPLTLTSAYAWYTRTWSLREPLPAAYLAGQIGLLAKGIGTSVDVDAVYATVFGVSASVATNAMTKPEERVIAALAQMQAFRSWTGSASEDEARARIYPEYAMPEDLVEAMPFAVVKQEQAPTWDKAHGGDQNYLRPSGAVAVALYDRERFGNDLETAAQAFKEFLGDVCKGLATIAGADVDGVPQLLITTIQPQGILRRTRQETDAAQGEGYWFGNIYVAWGDT